MRYFLYVANDMEDNGVLILRSVLSSLRIYEDGYLNATWLISGHNMLDYERQ